LSDGFLVKPGMTYKSEVDMHTYYVYILASKKNGTLYIGVTNNLMRRIYEHKQGLIPGFTKTYAVKLLVYFEETSDIASALQREKQLKRWKRAWKIELIGKNNPQWHDLYVPLSSLPPRASAITQLATLFSSWIQLIRRLICQITPSLLTHTSRIHQNAEYKYIPILLIMKSLNQCHVP
jgi:putative endonuclease